MTDRQNETLLIMLKNELEIITDYLDEDALESKNNQLMVYIDSAISFIQREGIALDLEDISDCQLVTMYASWLYDKRKDGVAIMPRMLRYNLNNRLFSQKVKE